MKKSTGISITSNFIRIAEAEVESGSIKALRFFEIPFSEEKLKDAKFLKHIANIVKKEKIYNRAFISLSNKDVIVKDKTVPPIKKEEIFKLIEAEIKDYAILNHQNVSLGFNIIEKAKDKTKIIWAGTKEETLLNLIKSFKKAGIKTVGVVPSNFAIGKFVSTFYEKESPIVIVNVDSTETTLTFMEKGKVLFTYSQDLGLNDIESNDPSLKNNWLGNILTTITFVARNRNLTIKNIFIMSQRDENDMLINLLNTRLPYPVTPLKIPETFTFKNEEDYLAVQNDGGAKFAEAVGLALFGKNGEKDPLFCDISKHVLIEKKSMHVKITATVLLLILINGAAFYFYPLINNTLRNLQQNIADTNKKIEIASRAAQQTEELKNELSAINGTLSQYETVKSDLKNRAITSYLLAELKSELPQGVHINSVSVSKDGNVSMSGTGPNYKTILDYEINLSGAKYVESATIHSMAKGLGSIVTFSMSAKVKGVNNEKK
jgi:Tfp pilus assembly protein PilN